MKEEGARPPETQPPGLALRILIAAPGLFGFFFWLKQLPSLGCSGHQGVVPRIPVCRPGNGEARTGLSGSAGGGGEASCPDSGF